MRREEGVPGVAAAAAVAGGVVRVVVGSLGLEGEGVFLLDFFFFFWPRRREGGFGFKKLSRGFFLFFCGGV